MCMSTGCVYVFRQVSLCRLASLPRFSAGIVGLANEHDETPRERRFYRRDNISRLAIVSLMLDDRRGAMS